MDHHELESIIEKNIKKHLENFEIETSQKFHKKIEDQNKLISKLTKKNEILEKKLDFSLSYLKKTIKNLNIEL